MLNHQKVLETLKSAFPYDRGVSLVARYADSQLQLPGGRAHIFIGDCHMLNKQDAEAYPSYRFLQDRDLRTLLIGLTTLKKDSPGQLKIWHLGDLFDIWRARGGLGPATEVGRITEAHSEICDLLTYGAPNGVGAQILAGNHDYELYKLPEWQAARYRIIENENPDGGDVLVLHGDIFEWIERLPDKVQERAVQFATGHAAGKIDLFNEEAAVAEINRGLKTGDAPIGKFQTNLSSEISNTTDFQSAAINVINAAAGEESAPNKLFFTAAFELSKAMRERGHDIRLMVIGHTHWARIVRGKTFEGKPFVLMDCGAWIGYCRFGQNEPWIHNGQIGVIADNEVRLYQIGWRPLS